MANESANIIKKRDAASLRGGLSGRHSGRRKVDMKENRRRRKVSRCLLATHRCGTAAHHLRPPLLRARCLASHTAARCALHAPTLCARITPAPLFRACACARTCAPAASHMPACYRTARRCLPAALPACASLRRCLLLRALSHTRAPAHLSRLAAPSCTILACICRKRACG